MRVGLIGYGYWGINLAKTIAANENLELVSIFDTSLERLEEAKKLYDFTPFSELDGFLKSDIEAIFIATPPQSHFELAKRALEANLHTFVEKPYTTSLDDAYYLLNLAEKKGLITMVDHVFVYSEPVKFLKQNIKRFGDIVYINSRRINLGLFQSAVDVIWDLAVHDLSIIQHLVGLDIKKASAFTKKYGSFPNCAFGDVHIELKNGILVGINVSWLSPIKVREMIIGGSNLTALYDDTKSDKLKLFNAGVLLNEEFGKQKLYEKMVQYHYGEEEVPKISNAMSLSNSVEYFRQCVAQKTKPKENHQGIIAVIKALEMISTIG